MFVEVRTGDGSQEDGPPSCRTAAGLGTLSKPSGSIDCLFVAPKNIASKK